jgi:hypothetical protein
METTKHNIALTSAEMATLWSTYLSDSLSVCTLKYFLEKVEDTEIRPILEYALNLGWNSPHKQRTMKP